MKMFMIATTAAALFCAGCDQTTKDQVETETVRTTPSGAEVKTETEVERKVTVDQ